MPRETIAVRVVREGLRVRDGYLGYTESGEQDVAGSPFEARFFRGGGTGTGFEKARHTTGETFQEERRVLTFLDPVAARVLQIGDIAIVPPCIATGGRELRATIQRIKCYERTVQCELLTGDAQSNRVKDHQS